MPPKKGPAGHCKWSPRVTVCTSFAAAYELLALWVAWHHRRLVRLDGDCEAVGHRPRQQLDGLVVALLLLFGTRLGLVHRDFLGLARRRQAVLTQHNDRTRLALGATAGHFLARLGIEAARGAILLITLLVHQRHLLIRSLLFCLGLLPILLKHLVYVVVRRQGP